MQAAVGAKARALRRDGDVAANLAVKIFRRRHLQPLRHMSPKRFADVDVLAGNPKRHFAIRTFVASEVSARKGPAARLPRRRETNRQRAPSALELRLRGQRIARHLTKERKFRAALEASAREVNEVFTHSEASSLRTT